MLAFGMFASFALATIVYAQTDPTSTLLWRIKLWVGILIPIAMALAVLFFLWGLAKFLFNNANSDAKEDGKRVMIWGVVALFVMVSVWGLVAFIQSSTDVTNPTDIQFYIPGTRRGSGSGSGSGSEF